jgi:hypothetical protein
MARSPRARVIGIGLLSSAGAERICSGSEIGEQFGHLFDGIAAITAIMRYAERRQKLAGSFSPPQHRVPSVLPFEAEEHPRFPDVQVGEGCAELPVGLLCHRQVHEIHAARGIGDDGVGHPDHESQVPYESKRALRPSSEAEVIAVQDFGGDLWPLYERVRQMAYTAFVFGHPNG